MSIKSDTIEESANRELSHRHLRNRTTVEDERLLQMVREACCEDESPIVKESSVTVEARRFHTVDREAE